MTSALLEDVMETITVTVSIPIKNRGKDVVSKKPMTNAQIAAQVSYVLNVHLQSYCQYVGAPKFGVISANGQVCENEPF